MYFNTGLLARTLCASERSCDWLPRSRCHCSFSVLGQMLSWYPQASLQCFPFCSPPENCQNFRQNTSRGIAHKTQIQHKCSTSFFRRTLPIVCFLPSSLAYDLPFVQPAFAVTTSWNFTAVKFLIPLTPLHINNMFSASHAPPPFLSLFFSVFRVVGAYYSEEIQIRLFLEHSTRKVEQIKIFP